MVHKLKTTFTIQNERVTYNKVNNLQTRNCANNEVFLEIILRSCLGFFEF